MNIDELPTWEDCRFKVPEGMRVVKGDFEGSEHVGIIYGDAHVAFAYRIASRVTFRAAVLNLIGSAFERKFPGRYMKMVNEEAKNAVEGRPFVLIDQDFMLKELAA